MVGSRTWVARPRRRSPAGSLVVVVHLRQQRQQPHLMPPLNWTLHLL
jgi:hypothetical protein